MSYRRLGSRVTLYSVAFLAISALLICKFMLTAYQGSLCWKLSGVQSHKQVPIRGDIRTFLTPLDDLLTQKKVTQPRDIKLEIDKSDRLMRLFVSGRLVKTYIIGLGTNPDIKKTESGDCATPEGTYYICNRNPRSNYYLSLWISYPNIEDAKNGLKSGLINKAVFNKIKSANEHKRIPPMETKLGGSICIHGGGAGCLDHSGKIPRMKIYDWTQGCIAVGRREIRELYNFLPIGTPVIIKS